ncbi:glutaminase A [Anaerococcus lactolyticus]|uniref:Glutaminase n=2 Tax=Anaerococcus lactolyticus TaxID=33032 RepID=C2BEI1_9FIRM|nr:glutaminase A [Anaerococcus lactolyticus]EEI86654.1 glutaminase A [Anaerococcus lactolyticus ATCC 51172]KGF03907.1 glutaminase [Anaerococcus lactolyticus S7-1-13]
MFFDRNEIDRRIRQSIRKSEKFIGQGEVASYIPELLNVEPDTFALSITSTSGDTYSYGDIDKEFSVQSISKILDLLLALHDNTIEEVYSKVGSEPTKFEFNSLVPITDKPANPFINAGAITTSSMIRGRDVDDKFQRILDFYKMISGTDKARLMEDIYKSEMETSDRNKAIAYYLKSKGIFDEDPSEVLDLYIRSCSIGTNVVDLSHFGAILANKGYGLYETKDLIPESIVSIIVSQMSSCGMYENSGKYLMNVGIPSKSGVSGAILGIVPGLCGIAVYSPRLDKTGNSVRGKELLKILSYELDLNIFIR